MLFYWIGKSKILPFALQQCASVPVAAQAHVMSQCSEQAFAEWIAWLFGVYFGILLNTI